MITVSTGYCLVCITTYSPLAANIAIVTCRKRFCQYLLDYFSGFVNKFFIWLPPSLQMHGVFTVALFSKTPRNVANSH